MLHACEEQSVDVTHGAPLLFATACTQLLSPLPLCFFPGSCAIPALAAARVCSHKVLLEKWKLSQQKLDGTEGAGEQLDVLWSVGVCVFRVSPCHSGGQNRVS